MATLKSTTIQQPSDNDNYITLTDHASAPPSTAGILHANTTSLYWEGTDLAAGGGDSMDKVKSQGPTSSGSATTTGLANTSVLIASGANTAINVLFDQGTTLAGAYNATIHVAGDCNMPGLAITSDGTNGSQTFTDISSKAATISAVNGHTHHDSGGSITLKTAGIGFGSGTDTAYNDTAMYFDGTGDNLEIDANADFGFGTGDFTIDFWYARAGDGDHNNEIIYSNRDSSGDYFQIYYDKGGPYMSTQNSVGGTTYYETFSVALGSDTTWHHYALVRTGTTWKWFFDGKSQTPVEHNAFQHEAGVSSKQLIIGGRATGTAARFLNGYLDNLRVTKG